MGEEGEKIFRSFGGLSALDCIIMIRNHKMRLISSVGHKEGRREVFDAPGTSCLVKIK
jgi:hypothetical protein